MHKRGAEPGTTKRHLLLSSPPARRAVRGTDSSDSNDSSSWFQVLTAFECHKPASRKHLRRLCNFSPDSPARRRGPITTKVSVIAGPTTSPCCGVWVPAFAGTTAGDSLLH